MSQKKLIKFILEKSIITFVAFATILSFTGIPNLLPIQTAQAASGSSINYKDDGGAVPDVFLGNADVAELIASIDAFESVGTGNQITSVILEIIEAMGPNNVSSGFTNADLAEIALYTDTDGSNTLNEGDTQIATSVPGSWTELPSSTGWTHTFSGLTSSIPTSYSTTNTSRILIVAKAASGAGVLDASPMKGFHLQVPQNGITVGVASGTTLTSFPTSYSEFFPPVWLGTEGRGSFGSPILISEIQTAGTATGDEFVELYNRSPMAQDVAGWSVKYLAKTATTLETGWTNLGTIPAETSIPANKFYLIGIGNIGATADTAITTETIAADGGFIGLFEATPTLIDWVGYGTLTTASLAEGGQAAPAPVANGSIERKAFPDSTIAKMITGGIHNTQGNSEDTNYNAGDFIARDASSAPYESDPQTSGSTAETFGGGYDVTKSPILINEVFYNTATAGTWIELYNWSTASVDITGWKIISNTKTYTIPATTTIAAGTFTTVHWNPGTGTDTATDLYTNNSNVTKVDADLGTYGGDVLLTLGDDTVKDYVQYGGSGFAKEATANTAGEWMTGDYVPNCLYAQSIGRRSMTGEDYNNSGDWQTYSSTSAGNPNMGGDSTAPSTVTSVSLTDVDTTVNSGIDGRDLTIVWTPATTPDSTFDRYKLYVLPVATSLDVDTHSPVDVIYGGQYQYTNGVQQPTYTYTGGTFIMKDSAAGSFSAGDYNAYVIAVDFAGNSSATAVSSAGTIGTETYEAASDTQKPFIMHMGVGQAKAGVDIVLVARFQDDRELGAIEGVGAQVVYSVDAGSNWLTVNCSLALANTNYYVCTIPSAAAVNGVTVLYYLKSADAASVPNVGYMSASAINDMTSAVSETTIKTAPFQINITATADYQDDGTAVDLSGNIYKSDGSVFANGQQPRLFIEGTGFGIITPADGTGLFEFADDTLPDGAYNLVAFKNGYMDMFMNVFKNDSINIYLNKGEMIMDVSGGDAYMEMPFVTWTAPGDGMMGAPNDIYCTGDCSTIGAGEMPITISFSKEMNANTINDLDASNAGSNIYLTPDGGNTRIAGKVKYVYNAETRINEARFYSSSHTTLTPGTFYSIVVTQNVTDISGATLPGGAMADGSFSNSFTTMMDMSTYMTTAGYVDISDGYATGGMMMPPYVKGTTPQPGAFNINNNTSVVVEFSEPMDSTSVGTGSVKLYPISSESSWTVGTAVSATVSLDQATQKIVTLNPAANLNLNTTNKGWYVLRIMGSVKSSSGVWLGNPMDCGATSPDTCLLTQTSYESAFQLNTATDGDTTPPTILGTYPSNTATGVDVGIGGIEIGFSEPMLPSTVTAQNITLKAGSSSVTGKVNYDPIANTAKFIPASALLANTQYTLAINTSVTDLAGVALAAINSITFTSGTADTTAPEIVYANADDYAVAITFSEPMNAAKQTDVNRWATSVLNPANYLVKTTNSSSVGVVPYSTNTALTAISGLSFSFDEVSNTVMIEGFAFTATPTDLQIFINNAKDKSNNAIANSGGTSISGGNATQCPIQNSTDTYGMLGPGGGGMMMMGPMGGGPETGPGMDMGMMGMKMAGAFPMNMMAGQTSIYFVDVPITKQIPSGGKVILTFPSGFDVSAASEDANSSVNGDINEWGDGTVTIASVAGVQSSRTITITTATSATMANDFLHMDIAGIVNSSIPKEFGTDGYTVDIKTMTVGGVVLENISSMPFFIQAGGSRTISGNVTATDAAGGTMKVYLGSPMTGPMETTTSAFSSGAATYSFSSLPNGEYFVFTDPFLTINLIDYLGKPMPEPVRISDGNATKNIALETDSAAGKTQVLVHLKGDFSTDDVDIFANSPTGFRVKTVTPGTTADNDYPIYLPDGTWMVGIGPAMPKGPMSGPASMPDWMPPMSIDVSVANSTVYENSGAANDGTITFDISTQTATTITGTVTDGASNGIANAEVFAYQPMGGFGGAHTKTATDGTFTLKIPVLGVYKIGAHKPGLPSGQEITRDVTGNITGLSIKIQKPAYTISGKVLNASSQSVAYAPVWAYQSTGSGNAHTMTDATGNYILYVDNGIWTVEADAPGVGWLQYDLSVTIADASQSSINLKPATDTSWYTISGTVNIDGAQINMPIRAVEYDVYGNYLGREYMGITNASGVYEINVQGTGTSTNKYYRVDIWTPDYGEVELSTDGVDNSPANILVSNANKTGADIAINAAALNSALIKFDNKASYSNREAFIKIEGITSTGNPTGFYKSIRIADISGTDPTVSLKTGDYLFFVDVPGTGSYIPRSDSPAFDSTKKCIEIDGTSDTINFPLPDISAAATAVTISGTIYAGTATSGNELADAWVWIGNPSTGFHTGTQANSSGAYSLTVPTGSSYKTGADKPGYMSAEPIDAVLTDDNADGAVDTAQNFVLTANTQTISGVVYTDTNSDNIYDTGEALPNSWVYAEEATSKIKAYGPVDATGVYSLGVTNGTWRVFGAADGYTDAQYSENGIFTDIVVLNNSPSTKNIKLTANANWTTKTKSKPITPASGGTVDDTTQNTSTGKASGSGVKITLPPNALGSSTSSGNVSSTQTSAVSATNSLKPFAGQGKTITATNNSGQPITTLSDYIDLEMVIYKADIDAETNIKDFSKLKTMKVGYWDDTLNEWVSLATTKTAQYKATATGEWVTYTGTATVTGFDQFVDDALASSTFTSFVDYKLVFKASTNHLTVFAVGTSPDGVKPKAPTGLTQTTGSGTSVVVSWIASSLNVDNTTMTDLFGYSVYRSTDASAYTRLNNSAIAAGTETYTDSTATAWTSYYYVATAGDDDDLESAYSTALRVCSNKTITNGTVASDCVITCNSGYAVSQSAHTCTASGGVVVVGGSSPSTGDVTPTYQTTATDNEEITEEEATTTEETTEATTTEKPISQMNVTELRAKIAQIQAQIQVLIGELAKMGVSAEAKIQFRATLKSGQTSDEVKALQQCLAKDTDVYPEGIVSGWFGPLTKAAVIRFQEKYAGDVLAPWGLTKGTGNVGKTTRQKLNEICE